MCSQYLSMCQENGQHYSFTYVAIVDKAYMTFEKTKPSKQLINKESNKRAKRKVFDMEELLKQLLMQLKGAPIRSASSQR